MVTDEHFVCTATVLRRVGGWEVPFDVAGANNQGNVVEIDDLAERKPGSAIGQRK